MLPLKERTSYRFWNGLLRFCAWYHAVLITLGVLDHFLHLELGGLGFLMCLLCFVLVLPALLVSFVVVLTMRENEKERERLRAQYRQDKQSSTDIKTVEAQKSAPPTPDDGK